MLSLYLTSRLTKHRSKDVVLTVLMEGSTVCIWILGYSFMNSIDYFNNNNSNMFFFSAYMSSPCHIELTLSEKEEPVKKEVIWWLLHFIYWWNEYCYILKFGKWCLGSLKLSFCHYRPRPSWQQTNQRKPNFAVVPLLKSSIHLVLFWRVIRFFFSFSCGILLL